MPESVWKPRTTVVALCERDGRYLLVRESVNGDIVFNQPAGHLDPDETLLQAVVRETMEETRYRFTPTALQGIYRFKPDSEDNRTYIRFLFRGEVGERIDGPLDQGIIAAEWLSYDEVCACRGQHRSPMVLQCIDDFRSGPGYPLDVLSREFA
jgi:8-oxo-dGTP pyrophosphatase MutT (NUDIX family)